MGYPYSHCACSVDWLWGLLPQVACLLRAMSIWEVVFSCRLRLPWCQCDSNQMPFHCVKRWHLLLVPVSRHHWLFLCWVTSVFPGSGSSFSAASKEGFFLGGDSQAPLSLMASSSAPGSRSLFNNKVSFGFAPFCSFTQFLPI